MNHQPANQPPTPKIAPELLIDFDFFAVKAIDGDLHRGCKQLHELLRRHSITNCGRMITEDFTYKGLPMRSGDLVLLSAALRNLDDRKYADPMTVDFSRAIKNHMGFGTGIHRCLGAQLARVELRVMLQEWLPRIPEFRIANEAGVVFKSGRINSVHNPPLMWSH